MLVGLEVREVLEGLRVFVPVLVETVFAGLGFSSGSPKVTVVSETHQMAERETGLTTDVHGHGVVISLIRETLSMGTRT